MPDGTSPNTAAASSTQGSGQTQEGAAGAAQAAASSSTAQPTEQGQQQGTGLLQLTQEQFEAMMRTRVSQALRADRRKRAQGAAPADGKPAATAPAETDADASETDELRTQLERIQAQLAQRDAELAQERRAALVAKVAGKHKLPAEIADLLQGATEADLDAHAARLAKLIGPPAAPRTEAGGGAKPAPPVPAIPGAPTGAAPASYPFQSPGDVAW